MEQNHTLETRDGPTAHRSLRVSRGHLLQASTTVGITGEAGHILFWDCRDPDRGLDQMTNTPSAPARNSDEVNLQKHEDKGE